MRAPLASVPVRTIAKRLIGVVGFGVYMLAVAYFLRFMTSIPRPNEAIIQPTATTQEIVKKPETFNVPGRLVIPAIKVNAVVTPAGLTSDGLMDIKKDPTEVAWYKFGPPPGDTGSAVIAGHYGWKNGIGSVFNELHMLKPGGVIAVQDKSGAPVSFVVRKIKLYDPDADASEIFTSNDGKSHLNLITCEGEWIDEKQSYSRRLVVFSDKT